MKVLSTENLFEIIKKYPMLYDHTHDDYKNCQKRDKMWHRIARDYGENGEELKRRWKSLKDTYAKHLRRVQLDPKTRKWIWADHMKFFLPYLSYVNRYSIIEIESDNGPDCEYEDTNMENDQNNIENEQNNLLDNNSEFNDLVVTKHEYAFSGSGYEDQDVPEIETGRNSPEQVTEVPSAALFTITNGVATLKRSHTSEPTISPPEENYSNKKAKVEIDDNECTLLAFAKTIKKFSPKRQAITRFKIAQLIMEQELLHIEECETRNNK